MVLRRINKLGMIWTALADYIIPRYKTAVQDLSPRSYFSLLVISYIAVLQEPSGSYLQIFPVFAVPAVGLVNQSGLEEFEDRGGKNDDEDDGKEGLVRYDTNGRGDEDKEGPDKAVIYARVSSKEQAEEGMSISSQECTLRELVEERDDLELLTTIKDEGESGTNFEREGFKKIKKLASRGAFSKLLIVEIDRIGRDVAGNLREIGELRKQGVVLETTRMELDLQNAGDKTLITHESLVADLQNTSRMRSVHRSKIHGFKQEKKWSSWYDKIPLGYEEDGDDWIEVDENEAELVRKIFRVFLEKKSYSDTIDELEDEYPRNLTRDKLKRILHNPVYVGKPTIESEIVEEMEGEEKIEVVDESLEIVDEDTFEEAQESIREIAEKYSRSTDSITPDKVGWKYGTEQVYHASKYLRMVCPDCDEIMVRNNQRELTGDLKMEGNAQMYKCPECTTQKRFPDEEMCEKITEGDDK